ncbi:hypothetical protein GOBAR_AA36211 [Gossypium barbadense]|uniref:Uncharacterized protein n=1 Tax=Gossypium barbadense TaxID=3634 RepID=A0A2P5W0A1_GOSBA|nr:hypothetical protein GOBAR_AA36211 [Gossypium barbadense]
MSGFADGENGGDSAAVVVEEMVGCERRGRESVIVGRGDGWFWEWEKVMNIGEGLESVQNCFMERERWVDGDGIGWLVRMAARGRGS